jgi:hypothetical protein
MRAQVGDRLVVRAHRVGDVSRTAEVLEAHGEGGAPPYLVRWTDDGHTSLLVPSSDVTVERRGAPAEAPAAEPAPVRGERHLQDTDVRLAQLEESLEAVAREVEDLREDLRALAAAVREAPVE